MKQAPHIFLLSAALAALLVVPAHALEYTFDAPDAPLFARPTSEDTIYEWENPNMDRSKNTAVIPPSFGSPASYLPGSGEHLTPNLVPGALNGGLVNQVGEVNYPSVDRSESAAVAYTEVTSDLYYANGSLGTLKIPAIGLTVKIYEGTDSAALAKGAGHFEHTSIWAGNVCLAAHNRGVTNHFGKIHTLSLGNTITLTTRLGTRTYRVTGVSKISATDWSGAAATAGNQITLYTCVRDEPAYRWCVVGIEV